MRTCSGVDAEHARGLVAVHVGRLRAGGDLHPLADRHGVAGLRLDIGVLDERGLEAALDRRGGRRRGRRRHRRTSGCRASARCRARARGARARPARARRRCPISGGSGVQAIGRSASETPSTAARVPTSASTASPRKRTWPGASTGWSCRCGKMPKEFSPGTSSAVRIATSPGVRVDDGVEIAEREGRARMRRAHDAHPERIGGRVVGAEDVGARRPWPAVDARKAGADGDARSLPPCGEGARRRGMQRRSSTAVAPHPSLRGYPLPARGRGFAVAPRPPSPPRRSSRSRCSGRARRRAHPRPRCGRRSACAPGNRPPPSACPACRCRIAPRRAPGTPRAAGR